MRDRKPATPITALIVVRTVAGGALHLAARRIVGSLPGHRSDPVTLTAARVIGARNLIEAGLLWHRPTRGRVLVGVGIDVTHSATMVGLAVARPEERGPALSSALGALAMAGAGAAAARTRS